MLIKTTMRYHCTPMRMTSDITNLQVTIPNAREDAEKLDHSHIASGNVEMIQPLEEMSLTVS